MPAAYDALARMTRLLAGAKLRLARRVDESREWRRRGYRNTAEYLAQRDGTTERAAGSGACGAA